MFRVLVTCLVRCWLGWVQAEGSRAAASARGAILRCAGCCDTCRATSSAIRKEGRKEMFYLTTHSTHFIYGYMASDIWLRTILIERNETRCCHMGYSFRLAARVLLYAPQACYRMEREIAQWVHPMKDRSDDPLHHE